MRRKIYVFIFGLVRARTRAGKLGPIGNIKDDKEVNVGGVVLLLHPEKGVKDGSLKRFLW